MSWSQPAFEAVARLVGVRTGLTFANRCESFELGIRRAMARAGVADVTTYLDRLAHDGRVLDDLVSDLTVGETYFFREPEQFQRIRREVLPDIRQRHGPAHVVRAWSAGCASGEEAYTLAIVFEQEGLGQNSHVLATDISQKALAAARRGICSNWSLRGENGTDALPYLVRSGSSYIVAEAIRKRVTFASLNLALDIYPSFTNGTWGMDLILCRNVLIYLDRDTVQNVARRLFQSLIEGGSLITASADPPLWDFAPFEVVATHQGVIYRKREEGRGGMRDEGRGMRDEGKGERDEGRGVRDEGNGVREIIADTSQVQYGDTSIERSASVSARFGTGDTKETMKDTAEAGFVNTSPSLFIPHPSSLIPHPSSPIPELRALANRDSAKALAECREMLRQAPFSTELNYLHAMLLLDSGNEEQAIQAMRRVIYLDRSLAIAHFTLASMLRRRGDLEGARRAYRNARDLCAGLPAETVLPLGEGEQAGRLAEVAGVELVFLKEAAN